MLPLADVSSERPADKLDKLIQRMNSDAGQRPKRRTSLLRHINAAYGHKLTEPNVLAVVDQLIARGVLQIDATNKVTY